MPALRDDIGAVRDLRPLTADIDGPFLQADGIERARSAAADLPVLDGADTLRVGAPIARPTAVICVGQNYAAQAAESGDAPHEVPVLFFKHPNTVVGPHDELPFPEGAA